MVFTWNEAAAILKPAFFYMIGVALYALFLFKFYHFLARKDILKFDSRQYGRGDHPALDRTAGFSLYLLQALVLFPIIVFFWFAVLIIFIVFLSKNQAIENIILSAFAIVGAIRISAYYNEELSKDLAKLLPLVLLGVFLIDISYFSVSDFWILLLQAVEQWKILLYYLLFIVVLEFILRIGHLLFGRVEYEEDDEEKEEKPRSKSKR